ncbi:MAG: acyltransferase family protein [Terriglobales bacterium]
MYSASAVSTNPAPRLTVPPQPTAATRLISLDAFRGLTIAGMVLVNNPGTWSAVYWPLRHADWHGWTPTDLVFPWFLFIVGVSMSFSFAKRLQQGDQMRLFRHVLYRSVIIWAIGFFLVIYPYFRFQTVRIPGVLARIAVCYLFGSIIYLWTGRRGRVMALAALLIGYWALMRFVPVPGYGAASWTPDGNLAAYIDRALLGGHLWKPTWDPEGLLSTLPAIGTVLFGTLCGDWLRSDHSMRKKVVGMLVAGAIGLAVGRALHPFFPINKNLWTSTYAIFTAGFGSVGLAICCWLIDVKGWRTWAKPLLVFGTNPILAYALSTFMTKNLVINRVPLNGRATTVYNYIFVTVFAPLASPINASLMFSISYVLLWMAIMTFFYRKKIFVKI